jgi:hypothetical protein
MRLEVPEVNRYAFLTEGKAYQDILDLYKKSNNMQQAILGIHKLINLIWIK